MIKTGVTLAALVCLTLRLAFGGATGLRADDPQTQRGTAPAPEGGKVVGILTHFEYNWTKAHNPKPDMRLSLKAEGETKAVDYLLALPDKVVDPKLELTLRKVFPSNTVSLQWQMRDGKRLVTRIAVLTPTRGQGIKRGTVIARDAGSIDLKGENRGAPTIRYVVPWNPRAKGPDPALAGALRRLNVGDRVAVTWIANPERVWLQQVKLLSAARTK